MVSFDKLDRIRKRDGRDDSRGTTLADRFASSASDSKRHKPMPEKFMRRSICRFWKEGTCHKAEGTCSWAHGEHEIGTLVEMAAGADEGFRPNTVKAKKDMTAAEAAIMTKLEAAAQERDRLAAMEAAGNAPSTQTKFSSSLLANVTPSSIEEMVNLQEIQAALDVQAYQQQAVLQEQQKDLARRLQEVEARGTPSDVVELQAKAMAMGTFGFGVGPFGEMDLARENTSPFIGKGINKAPKQPLISTHRVYMGIVKAWYASQKHGRIECDEIREAIGTDVYVYRDVLARASAGVGDVVCFSIFATPRGQLQASSPMVRTATHLGFAQTGIFRTGGPADRETEAGTIDCPEMRRVFGTEARVPKEMGKGLIFGRRVAFNAYMNNDGKAVVVSVEEVDEGFTPTPGNLDVTYTMPSFQGEAAAQPSAASAPPPPSCAGAMPFAAHLAGGLPPPPPPGGMVMMPPPPPGGLGMPPPPPPGGLGMPMPPPPSGALVLPPGGGFGAGFVPAAMPGGASASGMPPPPPPAGGGCFEIVPQWPQGMPVPPPLGPGGPCFAPPPPKADGFVQADGFAAAAGGFLGGCHGLPPMGFVAPPPPMG